MGLPRQLALMEWITEPCGSHIVQARLLASNQAQAQDQKDHGPEPQREISALKDSSPLVETIPKRSSCETTLPEEHLAILRSAANHDAANHDAFDPDSDLFHCR